jgi:hypothetical protein
MKPVNIPRRMHQDRASKAKTPTANGQELRPLNTIIEAAAFLNVKVSTLRKLKKDRKFKAANTHTNADMFSDTEVLRLRDYLTNEAAPREPMKATPREIPGTSDSREKFFRKLNRFNRRFAIKRELAARAAEVDEKKVLN